MSQIIKKIAVERGLLTDEDRSDEAPLRMLVGMGWEWACAANYPEIIWQPGELLVDGIALSPDGYNLTVRPRVAEFKYTRKSARLKGGTADQARNILGDWIWISQCMGYCYAASEVYKSEGLVFDQAELHVCWANGNYVWPNTEVYMRYVVEFERRELVANWMLMKSYREKVEGEVR